MPKNWLVADRNHWFGKKLRDVAEPGSLASAEDHNWDVIHGFVALILGELYQNWFKGCAHEYGIIWNPWAALRDRRIFSIITAMNFFGLSGNGLVGLVVVQWFLERGNEVVGLDDLDRARFTPAARRCVASLAGLRRIPTSR